MAHAVLTTRTVRSRDGTTIAYDVSGSGPALIFVGGAFSYRGYSGNRELADLLGDAFTCIWYDRRGRGDSTDTPPYAVEREVEDLDALIAAAGGTAYVYGMSSGAALAAIAAARGSRITKLALFEPPYMVGDAGHRPPPDHDERLKALLASGRRGAAVSFFLTGVMGMPWFIPAVMRWMPLWSRLKAVAHTLPYETAVLGGDFAFPARTYAAIKVPTLIAAGAKSPQVLRDAARTVARALPSAVHEELAGQAHNVSLKVLAPVLRAFFSAPAGGRAS
jgi:pimeloyl-ACP methyl ester carboxylesterase